MDWGDGEDTGKIVERLSEDMTKTIKGTDVTRKASGEDPALLIEQPDGDRVLNSPSKISAA